MSQFTPPILAALLLLVLPVSGTAQKAKKTEEPHAGKVHAPRGSQKELDLIKKNPTVAPKATLPEGSEVRQTLEKKERPALRFLQQGKAPAQTKTKAAKGFGPAGASFAQVKEAAKFPQHVNKLENPNIRHPKEFEVEYTLAADARVSFTLSTFDGLPLRRLEFKAGGHGGLKGKNRLSVWDGQDAAGRQLPPGPYFAQQEIDYGAETEPVLQRFPLHKK